MVFIALFRVLAIFDARNSVFRARSKTMTSLESPFASLPLFCDSQALHDGYLQTGVPGWGTAYQYATVSQTDPQGIINFLSSRLQEQVWPN